MKKILSLTYLYAICCVLTAQNIQSPKDFLGYDLGDNFTYHHRMVDYFEHIATQSGKVVYQNYGQANEGRPLGVAFVSSEENIQRLEQIRQNNRINTRLETGAIQGKEVPIVWVSYNIHGDEAASMEAAMKVLYYLVSSTDNMQEQLSELVVVIDPCQNPDGRDRYTNWYRQKMNTLLNTHPDTWEHQQPWPTGRFNHYLFDLNRDWAWLTQLESQQRVKIYQQWMPQIHVDLHEMDLNSPYFIGVGAEPIHEEITGWQRKFQRIVGSSNAKYFDENCWLYFSREVYDLFYPGYGDTWPLLNGAIGLTYEQGGSGKAGLGVQTQTDDTLTLKYRIAHHYTASLSTIATAYEHKVQLLSSFKQYFTNATQKYLGKYKSYLISTSNNSESLHALLQLLDRQQIQYSYAKSPSKVAFSGFDYLNNKNITNIQLKSEYIIINTRQPMAAMVRILFDPSPKFSDSVTYDLTAWALPYVYQLEAYAINEEIPLGKAVTIEQPVNKTPQQPTYAYYAAWENVKDVRLLSALFEQKIKVRIAHQDFSANKKDFPRGTLVITRSDNRQIMTDFDKKITAIANRIGVNVHASYTGLVEKGKDLGSRHVRYIKAPNVALLAGDGVSPTAFGELWYFFEQQINYPISVFNIEQPNWANLSDIDILIVPHGKYTNIKDKLLEFVKAGGRLILLEGAIRIVAQDKHLKITTYKKKPSQKARLKTYGEEQKRRISESVQGSIYKVTLDDTHPLAFGLLRGLHLVKRNPQVYQYIEGAWNVGVFAEKSHISGFTGAVLKEQIPNSLAIGTESYGHGQIVYIVESPLFRAFWYAGSIAMANAVFVSW